MFGKKGLYEDEYVSTEKRKFFRLEMEILLVILILSIILLVLVYKLDPFDSLADARNVQRWQDINTLSTALHTYSVDVAEPLQGLGETERQLGTGTSDCNQVCPDASNVCLDLKVELSDYLREMPMDPDGSIERSGYSIQMDQNGIITVKACLAEKEVEITMSR